MAITIIDHINREELSKCQEQIGYWFKDVRLLSLALTHTSRRNDFHFSNERLEYLGDSILGFIISEYLFKTFPNYCEGELTKIKSVVVSSQILAKVGQSLNLGSYLIVCKGLASRVTLPNSLYANVFEAIVGAIFMDNGIKATNTFVLDKLHEDINIVCKNEHRKNYKSLLQHCCQKVNGNTPTYKVLQTYGNDHVKIFQIAAVINNIEYGVAWGKTKKEASQKAAYHTLITLKPDEDF